MNNFLQETGLDIQSMSTSVCSPDYIDKRNDMRRSALMCAFQRGNMESCSLLLNCGADINDLAYEGLNLDSQVLKFHGFRGWTPLLTAAAKGSSQVRKYLETRRKIIEINNCLIDGTEIPTWLVKKNLFFSAVHEMRWVWTTFAKNGMKLSESRRKVTRENDNFDYSCALGNEVFSQGTYLWTMKLDDVKLIWLGMANRLSSLKASDSHENCHPDKYEGGLVVFGNDGGFKSSSKTSVSDALTRHGNTKFASGQTVGFLFDVKARSLQMRIDGNLAATVNQVDIEGLRPYVCMGYRESVTVLSQSLLEVSWADHQLECPHDIQEVTQWDQATLEHFEECREIGSFTANSKYQHQLVTLTFMFSGKLCYDEDEILIMVQNANKLRQNMDNQIQAGQACTLLKILGTLDHMLLKITGLRCVKDLKKKILEGSDINLVTRTEENSALHIAAVKANDTESVVALIESNAIIDKKNANGQTPLDVARKTCSEVLRLHGANNWTRLMISAEKSTKSVKEYMRIRSLLLFLEKGGPPPGNWFIKKVERFMKSNDKEELKINLKWEHGDDEETLPDSPSSTDKMSVTKQTDISEFFYAIGTDLKTSRGTCCWEISVQNVRRMWVGICCNLPDSSDLNFSPEQFPGSFLVAFQNSGEEPIIRYGSGNIQRDKPLRNLIEMGDSKFKSGDRVCFILDFLKNKIKMKINGVTAFHLKEITFPQYNHEKLRPFLCMCSNESATFTFGERCFLEDGGNVEEIDPDIKKIALENAYWKEIDDLLKRNLQGILFVCNKVILAFS